MATFTDVYKQELKSKGVLSSLGSAALKRTRERLDPRNILFGGSGMIAATGQKIFGKGYQAIQRTAPTGQKLVDSGVMQTQALTSLIESSKSQEAILRIVAKNTSNNNAMARDINVMRQNIMKLVTMGGGTASRGADMFFKDAAARESSFESQFKKERPTSLTAPTTVAKKEEGTGILSKILSGLSVAATGIIGKILTGISGAFSPIIAAITSMGKLLTTVFSPLAELAKTGLRLAFDVGGKIITGAVGSIGTLLRFAAPLLLNPAVLGVLGVGGIAWLIHKLMQSDTGGEASTAGMTSSEAAQAYGPEGPQPKANAGTEGLPTLEESVANAKKMREQRELELENKRLMSKGTEPAPVRLDSGRSAMDPRRLDMKGTSPTSEMDFGKQQLLDFIGQKESGALGYNALVYGKPGANTPRSADLTNMTLQEVLDYQRGMIERGHASTAVGRYQFIRGTLQEFAKKAGVSLSEKFTPEVQDRIAGALLDEVGYEKVKQGKMTMEQFQNRLAGRWASLPRVDNTSQYTGIAGNKILTSSDTLKGVISASVTGSMGTALASASTTSSDLKTAMSVQPAPNVVVNAPSTTTVAGTSRPQQVASATNVDALELFAKISVGA